MAAEELEPVSQQPGLQQVPQQQELLQAVVLQAQRFEMVLRAVRKQARSLELVQLLL
jgi:hypothetical protein